MSNSNKKKATRTAARRVPRVLPNPNGPQGPPMPQEPPSMADIAKRNIIQSMNSIGSMASGLLTQQVHSSGIGSVTEVDVDHAIELSNMLVFKMNALTKEELDRCDVEMNEEKGDDPDPEKKEAH